MEPVNCTLAQKLENDFEAFKKSVTDSQKKQHKEIEEIGA